MNWWDMNIPDLIEEKKIPSWVLVVLVALLAAVLIAAIVLAFWIGIIKIKLLLAAPDIIQSLK